MDKNLSVSKQDIANMGKKTLVSKSIQSIFVIAQFIIEVFKAMFDLVASLLEYKAVQYVALFLFVFVIVYQFLIMLSA